MITKDLSIRWNRFLEHFAEPVEQSIVGRVAEIVGRQNECSLITEIKCKSGEFNRFREAGCPCPSKQTETRKLLTRLARGAHPCLSLRRRERRSFPCGTKEY